MAVVNDMKEEVDLLARFMWANEVTYISKIMRGANNK